MVEKNAPWEDRYIPEPNSGCWLWLMSISRKGYGRTSYRGKVMAAHQAAYLIFKGEIPEGLEIDHKCRVRSCVNPDHLQLLTHRDNLRRRLPKMVCERGHLLTGSNTYVSGDGRQCRLCALERGRKKTKKFTGEADRRRKLNPEEINRIAEERKAGRPCVDIAAEFGVTKGWVRKLYRDRLIAEAEMRG